MTSGGEELDAFALLLSAAAKGFIAGAISQTRIGVSPFPLRVRPSQPRPFPACHGGRLMEGAVTRAPSFQSPFFCETGETAMPLSRRHRERRVARTKPQPALERPVNRATLVAVPTGQDAAGLHHTSARVTNPFYGAWWGSRREPLDPTALSFPAARRTPSSAGCPVEAPASSDLPRMGGIGKKHRRAVRRRAPALVPAPCGPLGGGEADRGISTEGCLGSGSKRRARGPVMATRKAAEGTLLSVSADAKWNLSCSIGKM